MKLRDKKTGEIIETVIVDHGAEWEIRNMYTDEDIQTYNSLTELNEEWEDALEEPKEWWYIDIHGPHKVTNNDEYYQQVKAASKEIGNYFDTREEAEKAVEKLKAWKRLKDKGFRFFNNKIIGEYGNVSYTLTYPATTDEEKDLDLLFGGEE